MGTPKGKLKFRSGLEETFSKLLKEHNIKYEYEKDKVQYIIPETKHTYTIDFSIDGLYIETKGRFTSVDRRKMLLVKKQNPEFNFVMVFNNARRKKINKGSKTSYADWCDKNSIKWLELKDIERDINCLLNIANTGMPSSLKIHQSKSKRLSSL